MQILATLPFMVSYFICEWKIRKLSGKEVSELIDTVINCECLLFAGAMRQSDSGNFITFEIEAPSEQHLSEFITKAGREYGIDEWIPEDEWLPNSEKDREDFINISRNRGKLALTEVCQTFGES